LNPKRERRIAVYTSLCSGHSLIVVFRGDAGVEHVAVSEKTSEDPNDVLAKRGLLEEISAVVPLDHAPKEYVGFINSLKEELDKLICREVVYRAR
jgi:hypothetical protein